MNNLIRIKQHEITTILDLPTELIENICSRDVITLADIYNLAICHSKLNNSLFHEQNSVLWKSKYIQKLVPNFESHVNYKLFVIALLFTTNDYFYNFRFGPLCKNEYEIVINEENTWRNEISLRLSLSKKVPYEIEQMPGKYMRCMSIPYHLFPFKEQLHSKYQSHRFYVLSSVIAYYKGLLSNEWYFIL